MLAAIVVPFGALMVGVRRVYPFISDDALISLRYADRWLAGQGLTWDDHDAVEGYSNLAWVVLCAGLGAAGVDLIDAARVLGVLCTITTFAAVVRFATRDGGSPVGALVANTLLALLGTIYVWAVGGLETPLVAASLAWGWALTDGLMRDRVDEDGPVGDARWRPWAAGAAWAVLVLTRPDGPLFVAISGLALLWHHRGLGLRAVRWGAPSVGLPLVAWLGQLAFRLLYYGDWVPNPAHVKAEVTWRRIEVGAAYVGEVLYAYAPLVGLAGLALVGWRAARLRTTGAVIAVSLVAWALYVTSVGGDIFPGHRHGVPIAVGLGLLVVIAHDAIATTLRGRVAFLALSLGVAGALAWSQPRFKANRRAVTERWEWDAAVTGRFFAEAFADDPPLVAVTAAGAIPYFSRLPALDLFGLNDRHIARTPARGRWIAHDRGDADYVMDREPDLIVFGILGNYRPPPSYRRELGPGSRLHRDYVRIRVRGRDPWPVVSSVWARREGRAGLRQESGQIVVPGYFFGGTVAELAPDGSVLGRLEVGSRPEPLELALPEGTWRARWPEDVAVTVAGAPGGVEGRDTIVAGPADLAIAVTPPGFGTALSPIVFERTSAEAPDGRPSLPVAVEVGPVVAESAFVVDTRLEGGVHESVSEPLLVPDGGVLAFRLQGDADPHQHRLEVIDAEGRVALTFVADGRRPQRSERLVGLEGQEIRLRAVDEDPRPRYRIAVSEVRLHRLVPREAPTEE